MKVKRESEVAQSCPTLSDPWTAAHQAPPSMGFSRQEYWSGVPVPSPVVHVKHTLNSKIVKYSTINFILITCLNDNFVFTFRPDFFKQLY